MSTFHGQEDGGDAYQYPKKNSDLRDHGHRFRPRDKQNKTLNVRLLDGARSFQLRAQPRLSLLCWFWPIWLQLQGSGKKMLRGFAPYSISRLCPSPRHAAAMAPS